MQKIVVAYDGSEPSQRALERAADLAENGSSVTVVSAVHNVYGKGGVAHDPIEEEDHRRHLREARSRLAELGIEAHGVEGFGDPAKVIAEQAKGMNADLIVVGSHGKNLLERLLLGSVSTDVEHRVPPPPGAVLRPGRHRP